VKKTDYCIRWNEEEEELLKGFADPWAIEVYLDAIDYNPDYVCRSPRWVMRKRSAHCFEGGLFAAAHLIILI
jgi:hypothetical protein